MGNLWRTRPKKSKISAWEFPQNQKKCIDNYMKSYYYRYDFVLFMWKEILMQNEKSEQKWRRFNYISNEINGLFHEAALKMKMSDSEMLILYTICNEGNGCLLSEVYKTSGISKQTINSAVRKLEKEEIVYLKNVDGRSKKIFLTEKGQCEMQGKVLRIIELENTIFGSWTEEEQELYVELTQRFESSFREKLKKLWSEEEKE